VGRFKATDLFDTPYDLHYVEGRIAALATNERAEWVKAVDQIRRCANPPRGMHVDSDARALAQAKMKELAARNRFPGRSG